jgi:hypothetical protein
VHSAMGHPPYSPDLALADFKLFPKLKNVLKGKSFSEVENIKFVYKILTNIPAQYIKNCSEELLALGNIVKNWRAITLKN